MNLDILLPYLKMGEYVCNRGQKCLWKKGLDCNICCVWKPTNVLFTVAAALQKVSHQSCMTVEKRTEEANWFRKIGTKTLSLLVTSIWHGMLSLKILHHLNFCLCVSFTAWNAALQCESSPDRMRDFFVLSYQASALISFVTLINQ